MASLLTIMTFTYPHEAAMAQSALDAEGIPSFLKDELSVQVQPGASSALGGVKLQVALSDANRAARLLLDLGYLKESDIAPDDEEEDDALITFNVGRKYEKAFRILLIVLFIGITIGAVLLFRPR